MKLNNIQIENFRGFKHYSIEFADNTTVLIGKNGTGKTQLSNEFKKIIGQDVEEDEGNLNKKQMLYYKTHLPSLFFHHFAF